MNLFQHKTLGGGISITTTPRYPADGGKVAADFSVVASFGNDEGGQLAYRVFCMGLSSGPYASSTLFNEDTQQFDMGSLEDMIPDRPHARSRGFVYGVNAKTGEPVWARNIDGVISWHTEAPTPEQDVITGGMGDDQRAIYNEIKDNSTEITDIGSLNVSGPRIMTEAPAHPALR